MTLRQTYYPIPTQSSVFDSAIAYVKMLFVARSGVVYDVITNVNDIMITSRQVHYNPSTGIIQFDANIPFNEQESINVIYDTNI
jgi:hypothetical protein